MKIDLRELNKVERYLKENKIDYQRKDQYSFDEKRPYVEIHQLIVHGDHDRKWDVICHPGSYGYKEGLLEIMGNICRGNEENVEGYIEGYLTAEEVIERIKEHEKD